MISLDVSQIQFSCQIWQEKHSHRTAGLITFVGSYPIGSAGKEDALFIRWKIREFYDLVKFSGLVVDCRALSYSWGDDLNLHPTLGQRDYPYALVITLAQQEAYSYVEPQENHRFDLEKALFEINERIKVQK